MENWLKFEHIELFDGSVQKLKSFIEIVDLFHEIYKTKNINEKHFLTVIKYCKLSENVQYEFKNKKIDTWDQLKSFLQDRFKPSLKLMLELLDEMNASSIKQNETLTDFIARLNYILTKIKNNCGSEFELFHQHAMGKAVWKIKDLLSIDTIIILGQASTLDEIKITLEKLNLGDKKMYGKFLPLIDRAGNLEQSTAQNNGVQYFKFKNHFQPCLNSGKKGPQNFNPRYKGNNFNPLHNNNNDAKQENIYRIRQQNNMNYFHGKNNWKYFVPKRENIHYKDTKINPNYKGKTFVPFFKNKRPYFINNYDNNNNNNMTNGNFQNNNSRNNGYNNTNNCHNYNTKNNHYWQNSMPKNKNYLVKNNSNDEISYIQAENFNNPNISENLCDNTENPILHKNQKTAEYENYGEIKNNSKMFELNEKHNEQIKIMKNEDKKQCQKLDYQQNKFKNYFIENEKNIFLNKNDHFYQQFIEYLDDLSNQYSY